MAGSIKRTVGNMTIEDFKALISEVIDEKLASYRLVHVDEQGYMYVFTKESLLPLDREFEAGLEESVKQGEQGQLTEQKEVWPKLGI